MSKMAVVVSLIIYVASTIALGETPSGDSAPDPWAPIGPLLGSWVGTEIGSEDASRIEREYTPIMDGKFVRTSTLAAFEPTEPGAEGEIHEDIGFFSYDPDRDVLLLREFMSDGYVVTYALVRATADSLILVSESSEGAGGYGARLRYSFAGPDDHIEELDLAPPGGAFFTCHRMKMTRQSE